MNHAKKIVISMALLALIGARLPMADRGFAT